jgi:hypothetical protein
MSEVKVNKISPRIDCGTVQLGDSGDTITIPAGATIVNNGTQTGFGRTGTVDWDTTAKTASFTAVSGNGYFVNTTSGSITMNLPATPSAGDIVSIKDYAFTFATNNFIVDGNGSPIGGVAGTIPVTYTTNGTSKTFVYVDGTKGWLVTNESTDTSQESNPLYVTATGGTILTCGNFKTHVFTGPGTFCVSCAGNPVGSTTVDYFVVAGGGSGASGYAGGGGGAGGFRLSNSVGCLPAPSMSPLANPTGLPVSVQGYPVTVGGGGTVPSPGSNSIFSTITSTGGGNGGYGGTSGGPGGSGGGQGAAGGGVGSGNTPPVSPPQGNPGGNLSPIVPSNEAAGGGGGAIAAGSNGIATGPAGDGGAGSFISDSFMGPTSPSYGEENPGTADTRAFAGGGGAGAADQVPTPLYGSGGLGGGGDSPAGAGTTNTGGGGGGGGDPGPSAGNGGSGIVMIRYKYQ